jgi:hypothetical protein
MVFVVELNDEKLLVVLADGTVKIIEADKSTHNELLTQLVSLSGEKPQSLNEMLRDKLAQS